MSGVPIPTTIRILEKEYVVSCPDGEQDALRASVSYLDDRMREARESGNIIGTERVAVMTALNLVHDYLRLLREREAQASNLASSIHRLEEKVGATIQANRSARE